MIKPVITDLDQKIATFIGWRNAHPFSTSDSYVGVVKRYIEKQGLHWSIRYNAVDKKFLAGIKNGVESVYGESESENLAICIAFSEFIDKPFTAK